MILLGLTASANAVSLPGKLPMGPYSLPGASIGAISLPSALPEIYAEVAILSISAVKTTPAALPTPIPSVIIAAIVPFVPVALPLPASAIVAHIGRFTPKPEAHATAMNELRDVAVGREPIRVETTNIFDGRRETIRETALPHDKFF